MLTLAVACSGTPQNDPADRSTGPIADAGFESPAAGTYRLPPIQDAADGVVIDADGTRRRLFDYMGDRNVFLSFVYTNCKVAKGCPLAMAVLNSMERRLEKEAAIAGQVRFITLSFDPVRDTPAVMRRHVPGDYIDTPWDQRPWIYLTTESPDAMQPILDGYGQYIVPEIDESGEATGDFSHILKVFLIDRQRRVRNIYSSSFIHPTVAINDLKTLLLEDSRSN